MDSKKIYACEVHINDAMDDLINYEETFPIIEELKGNKCSYCNEEASYIVKTNE